MSDQEPSDEEIAEADRAIADLNRELERVGVDMRAVGEAFRALYSEYLGPEGGDEAPTFGIDAPSALERVRTLPSGAGTEAFLIALGLPTPPSS